MHERGAFRVLVRGAVALLPAVIVGAFIGPWPALVVALVGLGAAATWTALRWRASPRIKTAPRRLGPPGELRLLVVANDALGDARLPEIVARASRSTAVRIFLLAPLAVSSLERWTSSTDAAHATLSRRLMETALTLTAADVETAVVDEEPLQALEDALGTFGPDEVLIITREQRSELARQAYARFAVPVSHVALEGAEDAAALGVLTSEARIRA